MYFPRFYAGVEIIKRELCHINYLYFFLRSLRPIWSATFRGVWQTSLKFFSTGLKLSEVDKPQSIFGMMRSKGKWGKISKNSTPFATQPCANLPHSFLLRCLTKYPYDERMGFVKSHFDLCQISLKEPSQAWGRFYLTHFCWGLSNPAKSTWSYGPTELLLRL